MPLADFIPHDGQRRIAQAITEAEKRTSGEICVHVTPHCAGHPLQQAQAAFDRLELFRTQRRNAVLIYIAYVDRKVAILGDEGINSMVGEGFWDDALALLKRHLLVGRPVDGVCATVALLGQQLQTYYPADRNDLNELSNEVTYAD